MSNSQENGLMIRGSQRELEKTATKEQYTDAVTLHAATLKEEYLFAGVHYRKLASFLRPPNPTRGAPGVENHSFAIMQTYSANEAVKITEFHDILDLQSATDTQLTNSSACQLLFLRGFPSADWLNALGAAYRLDPEFMRRHLDFLQPDEYYDLPPLPSSSNNMLRLRINTICKRSQVFGYSHVEKSRRDEVEEVRKHQSRLGLHGVVGESIVRRSNNHDEMTFTLEQDVSCCVTRRSGRMLVIIWLDTGKNLENGPWGPWLSSSNSQGSLQNICQPIIQHRPKGALLQSNNTSDAPPIPRGVSKSPCSTFQSAMLLPTQYGSTMDKEIIQKDPLYLLGELFSFAAHSESQFLNLVQVQITTEVRAFEVDSGRSMDNLRYHKHLLDEHIERISDTVRFLVIGGGSSWKSSEPQSQIAKESLESSKSDFEYLLTKAKTLANLCVEGSNTIMQKASLEESRKGLSQATIVGRLTLLAFIFLPLSLATSLFGMNFQEFGSGRLSIWVFAATLIPLLAISLVAALPGTIPWYGSRTKKPESHIV